MKKSVLVCGAYFGSFITTDETVILKSKNRTEFEPEPIIIQRLHVNYNQDVILTELKHKCPKEYGMNLKRKRR